MDFLKHIEDFGKGVFDSVVTAPYALGDFIARGTGFRDWQMGTGSYYMEQAKIETDLILTATANTEAQKLLWEQIRSEVQEKPMYFLGGFIISNAISKGALAALETKGVTNEVKLFVYPKEMTTSLLLAKIDNSIHTLIKENPEFDNILKESGVLDTITEDNISSVLDNITSNPLNNFYSNEYKLLSDKLKDLSIATANNLADTANISLYDPIALDLDGNGKIDTLSLENGVFFDHNGDKVAFKSSWVNSSDGILARDIDGDGKITSGAELFGNFTKLKNGELAKNGAQALKDLDDNNDGIFDSNDKAFNEILVWQDKNSDGISQKNELKTLNEHNIKSIDLEFMADNTALDKDNKQILIGSFSTNISNESKNNLASDIDFSVNSIKISA